MRKRIGRILCLGLALLLALLPAAAGAMETEALLSGLLGAGGKPARLELRAEFRTLDTLDEHRAELLNRVLSHFSMRLDAGRSGSTVLLLADGQELAGLFRRTTGEGTETVWSVRPDTLLVSDPEPADSLEEKALLAERLHLGLRDGYEFFRALPEKCGDRAKVTAEKKKVNGYGAVTTSVQLAWAAEEAGDVAELVRGALPGALGELLDALIFSGKQKLTMLEDESGAPLMLTWTGKAGTDEEHLREIRLEWRCLRGEESVKDKLTLRSPALKGTDRDNLTLERELKAEEEGETYTLTCSYDRMADKKRTQTEIKCSLTWKEGLSGSLVYTEKTADGTEKTELRPELTKTGDGEYEGTLAILRYSGKIVTRELLLTLRLTPGDEPARPETTRTVRLESMNETEREALEGSLAAELTRAFLLTAAGWPPEDLEYLSEGLPEEDWGRVLDAISKQRGEEE